MGLAEVVPGVSGGTIAFVTGIYPRLVAAIASFGPASVIMLPRWRQFAAHHDIYFLLCLAAGMGLGIIAFAQLMSYLLEHFRPVVWGFFSGVILMSVWVIGSERTRGALLRWAFPGLLAGLSLLVVPPLETDPTIWFLFAGAGLAVCAWLLPAVSGSYVLLTLGLYSTVIDAIAAFDLVTLAIVAAGCATGLMLFARALARILGSYPEPVLSLLTGFMLGSVVKLWPWQGAGLISPARYAAQTGDSGHVLAVISAAIVGAFGLWLLARLTRH